MFRRMLSVALVVGLAACGAGEELSDGAITSTTEPQVSGSGGGDAIDVDVCSLLTLDELRRLGVEVEPPEGEDDLGETVVQQCTFWVAGSVTVTPVAAFDEYYSDGNFADMFEISEFSGPGRWAGTAVDPDTGLVFSMASGGSRGVVAITPWIEILPGAPEEAVLKDLLSLAVSRLDG